MKAFQALDGLVQELKEGYGFPFAEVILEPYLAEKVSG